MTSTTCSPLALCGIPDGVSTLDFSVEKSPAKGTSKKSNRKRIPVRFLITTKNYDHNFTG